MEKNKLLHRINRIQGQLDAVKRSIEEPNNSCTETMRQIKAAYNATKKLGEAYITYSMNECMSESAISKKEKEQIEELIESSFTL